MHIVSNSGLYITVVIKSLKWTFQFQLGFFSLSFALSHSLSSLFLSRSHSLLFSLIFFPSLSLVLIHCHLQLLYFSFSIWSCIWTIAPTCPSPSLYCLPHPLCVCVCVCVRIAYLTAASVAVALAVKLFGFCFSLLSFRACQNGSGKN